jgi:hypothetical protein
MVAAEIARGEITRERKERTMKYVAVLVLSFGLLAAPQLDTTTGVYTTSDGVECPREGKPTGSEGTKELNPLKIRFTFPKKDDIDENVTLAAMLAPGDDTGRFDSNKAATISGFVVKVKSGGPESCNCGAGKPIDMDTHIMLGLSNDAPKTQCVIVEVTPRIRLLMAKQDIDWSTETLKKENDSKGIAGKWVTVTGWLMFDAIHADVSENINPGKPNNQRATCCELHPVTKIEILTGPPDGTPHLQPAVLTAFQKAHAQHAKRDPKRQEAIDQTIKMHLSKFNEEDLKEKEEELKD